MSAGVEVPTTVAPFAELESAPARAGTFATNLRAITVGVEDVQAWAAGSGAPSWAGRTRDAHDHARTRFGHRLDRAEAALERAVVATDRFEDRLQRLTRERVCLERERSDLNGEILALAALVLGAQAVPVDDPVALADLRQRARLLTARAASLRSAIVVWTVDAVDAETDYVRALATLDSLAEGSDAAADPGRVEVDQLVRRLERLAGDPAAVAAWWAALTRAQRQGLITERPGLVGNTGGVPIRDRDEANRAAVYHDVDHLGRRDPDELSQEQRRRLENAEHVREALARYRHKLDPTSGEELLHVIVYDPTAHDGDGGVAVGLGDPDTADHVSVTVPGLTTETDSLLGNLDDLDDLYDAAVDADRGEVASVYWGDYDAPSGLTTDPLDYLGVVDDAKAEVGGERLADFLDQLAASDRGDAAHLTAIGHSYGSATLGQALADGIAVDDAVVVGSPGVPAATVADLTAADVWVGSMDNDPVSLLGEDGTRNGVLGHDPATDDFGAERFATGDGSPRIEDLLDNHRSYFEDESLANIARVVIDDDAAVTVQPHRGDPGGGYLPLEALLAISAQDSAMSWLVERGEDLLATGRWLP